MNSTATEIQKPRVTGILDPDRALVESSKSGDVSAFEELVRRYDGKLYRIAQGITHNNEDAEEVVQTAFLKAYQNLDRFQGNARFSTWLIRIAMNESCMKLRKQVSKKEQSLDTQNGFRAEENNDSQLDLTDWATNPESLYSAAELKQILGTCLQKLQPTLRVVFFLRDLEGHSISETSGILNLTATAVRTRLSRARLQLRQELTRYFKKATS
jgi:RNA polymerase sigma-70 factor (ECF subfamily)